MLFIVLLSITLAVASAAAVSLPSRSQGSNDPCQCTFGTVPVPVDVSIPVDPENGLNTTNLRRLKAEFNIFGMFCQPKGSSGGTDRIQMLLHGSSYTHQYWTFPMNGFQNYSYVAHACLQGQTTFAYDQLGVGLSERPDTSTDAQLPVAAQISSFIAKRLKDGTIASRFGLGEIRFSKVVGIGHSQGSIIFNYAAIVDPAGTGLDAMILTGLIHDPGFPTFIVAAPPIPASEVNPARWGDLDPGWTTAPNRSQYYSPDTSAFSPDVFMLDTLTLDLTSKWYARAYISIYVPARGYTGAVVELVGSMDQLHCLDPDDGGKHCDENALDVSEAPFWPDSRSLKVVVREGSGHDVNLDFGAAETFELYSRLAETLV